MRMLLYVSSAINFVASLQEQYPVAIVFLVFGWLFFCLAAFWPRIKL